MSGTRLALVATTCRLERESLSTVCAVACAISIVPAHRACGLSCWYAPGYANFQPLRGVRTGIPICPHPSPQIPASALRIGSRLSLARYRYNRQFAAQFARLAACLVGTRTGSAQPGTHGSKQNGDRCRVPIPGALTGPQSLAYLRPEVPIRGLVSSKVSTETAISERQAKRPLNAESRCGARHSTAQ